MEDPAAVGSTQPVTWNLRFSLLAAATLPVMANFCIAPVLAKLQAHFSAVRAAPIFVPMLLTLPAAMGVVSSPVLGALLDRVNKRRVLIVAAAAFGILGVLPFFLDRLNVMLFTRVLLGIAEGALMTGVTAMVADAVSGYELKRFYSLMHAVMSVSGIVFLSAGGMLGENGWRQPFLLFGLGLVVAVALTTTPQVRVATTTARAAGEPYPWRLALPILSAPIFGWLLYYLIPSGLPFLLRERGLDSPKAAGFAGATAMVCVMMTCLVYPRMSRRLAPLHMLAVTYLLMAAGFGIVAGAEAYRILVLGCAVTGLGFGLLMPNVAVMLLGRVAPAVRGRAAAGISMSVMIAVFFTPLLRHFAATALGGTGQVFMAASVLLLCVGLALVFAGARATDGTPKAAV